MAKKWLNNFETTLQVAISSGSSTINFPSGVGARLDAINFASNDMNLTLGTGENAEIINVIGHASGSDIATVARAQDGTSARAWPAGTPVACTVTRAQLEGFGAPTGGSGGLVTPVKLRVTRSDFTYDSINDKNFLQLTLDASGRNLLIMDHSSLAPNHNVVVQLVAPADGYYEVSVRNVADTSLSGRIAFIDFTNAAGTGGPASPTQLAGTAIRSGSGAYDLQTNFTVNFQIYVSSSGSVYDYTRDEFYDYSF